VGRHLALKFILILLAVTFLNGENLIEKYKKIMNNHSPKVVNFDNSKFVNNGEKNNNDIVEEVEKIKGLNKDIFETTEEFQQRIKNSVSNWLCTH